jgi:hypothetical protein
MNCCPIKPKENVSQKTLLVYSVAYHFNGGEVVITKIRTNIFLTRTELKKLRALSKKNGAPVAELVRRAVDEYLERFERKAKK